MVVQYWRSFDHLHGYVRDAETAAGRLDRTDIEDAPVGAPGGSPE